MALCDPARARWIAIAVLSIAATTMPTAAQSPRPNASPPDVAFVDALTWGVTTSMIENLRSLGRERWLKEQLHPPPERLPADVQKQIAVMSALQRSTFDLVTDFDAQSRSANQLTDPDLKATAQKGFQEGLNDVARQAAGASILRALYSPDQIRERMTWFWFNHFNVHQAKANLRLLVADYESALRGNALRRFREILETTLRHPAMLRYLDNTDNANGHINENYAREIMELHTLGVGSGYSQKDVEELARILTGVGIDLKPDNPKLKPEWGPLLARDGLFEFNPARHDFGDKTLLGHVIKGSGFDEVEQALDILAAAPATAKHISRQIATYFVGDIPPPALIDRMAQVFTRTNGDIASVLDAMCHSAEFTASLGTRFKDPARYVFSALRLAYDTKNIVNTMPVQGWLNRLAEGLYNHQTPDGFALTSSAWNGSGQMMTRFEIARQIGSNSAGLFRKPDPDSIDLPAFPVLQNSLYFSSLRTTLSAQTNAALDAATSPQDWNTLYLSSPEFMN